jgi:hypothetical protein
VCVHVCSLLQVREQLTQDGMDIGNFERVKKHLHLGSHSGNRFKVVLRSIHPKTPASLEGVASNLQSMVDSALQSARTSGFVNYFGLQRLSPTLRTPRIGLAMLHNDVVRLRGKWVGVRREGRVGGCEGGRGRWGVGGCEGGRGRWEVGGVREEGGGGSRWGVGGGRGGW